jgi:hypothetical protein
MSEKFLGWLIFIGWALIIALPYIVIGGVVGLILAKLY